MLPRPHFGGVMSLKNHPPSSRRSKTRQDRGVALLVIGADELRQNKRVKDLDEPSIGEAALSRRPL